jgi:hypothetical protein
MGAEAASCLRKLIAGSSKSLVDGMAGVEPEINFERASFRRDLDTVCFDPLSNSTYYTVHTIKI